jgi:excisionase family DNA binding protein
MSEPLTVSVEEAGRLLGVSRGVAYEAARSGQLPTIRLGRRILVPRARLLELVGVNDATPEMRTPGLTGRKGVRGDAHESYSADPPAAA